MEQRPIPSGVGLMTGRIGDTFPTIEKYFPLPNENPKRFQEALLPRFTDTLFIKTIYQLANRSITFSDLSRTASYHRMSAEWLKEIIQSDLKEIIFKLEPRFTKFPEILENFTAAARRYAKDPFPSFEIDFIYGEADIYHDGKLIEMKAYSVMTRGDLIHARNQVLLYACLSRHLGDLKGDVKKIEVINSLTNEVWTWDFEEFANSGEADRFYWCVIVPLIGNNSISHEEISCIRDLYEKDIQGLEIFSKILKEKYYKPLEHLQRKVKEQEKQLKMETNYRHMLISRHREPKKFKIFEQHDIDYEYVQKLFV